MASASSLLTRSELRVALVCFACRYSYPSLLQTFHFGTRHVGFVYKHKEKPVAPSSTSSFFSMKTFEPFFFLRPEFLWIESDVWRLIRKPRELLSATTITKHVNPRIETLHLAPPTFAILAYLWTIRTNSFVRYKIICVYPITRWRNSETPPPSCSVAPSPP